MNFYANFEENALFSGKIYTAGKKFTLPPVATNFKSGQTLRGKKLHALNVQTLHLEKKAASDM